MSHSWVLSPHTSPSGKALYHCPVCKLYDPAPVKDEYENRECIPGKYAEDFEIADNVVRLAWRSKRGVV